jgi:hypothetical protein
MPITAKIVPQPAGVEVYMTEEEAKKIQEQLYGKISPAGEPDVHALYDALRAVVPAT